MDRTPLSPKKSMTVTEDGIRWKAHLPILWIKQRWAHLQGSARLVAGDISGIELYHL